MHLRGVYVRLSRPPATLIRATLPAMLHTPSLLLVALTSLALPSAALAQRATFERTFDVTDAALNVSTTQGQVEVRGGATSRVVVRGTVSVRLGWDVPANAAELVRAVADHPPVTLDGRTVTVEPPKDTNERKAVTIAYVIEVPPATTVAVSTQSGATSLSGITGNVAVTTQSGATSLSGISGTLTATTQSGALTLRTLGGAATVSSQSGAVTVNGSTGPLTATTQSGAFNGSGIGGDLRVRTQSGAIEAGIVGSGSVDAESSSGSIRIERVAGALRARSGSGRIVLNGRPGGAWDLSTGSGAIEMSLDSSARFTLDATTGSGSVTLSGASVQAGGVVEKKTIRGDVGSDGPVIRANSRSGSVRIEVARPQTKQDSGSGFQEPASQDSGFRTASNPACSPSWRGEPA